MGEVETVVEVFNALDELGSGSASGADALPLVGFFFREVFFVDCALDLSVADTLVTRRVFVKVLVDCCWTSGWFDMAVESVEVGNSRVSSALSGAEAKEDMYMKRTSVFAFCVFFGTDSVCIVLVCKIWERL